jgi:hypothetical protein
MTCKYCGYDAEIVNKRVDDAKEWHKIYNRPIKVIVTLNGAKVDNQNKSLSSWF